MLAGGALLVLIGRSSPCSLAGRSFLEPITASALVGAAMIVGAVATIVRADTRARVEAA
jgi:hypothetical protein